MFDFTDVPTIGQAFPDEIFRVFAQQHPEMEIIRFKASTDVKRIIERAKSRETMTIEELADAVTADVQ
jgi:hypothetical protein